MANSLPISPVDIQERDPHTGQFLPGNKGQLSRNHDPLRTRAAELRRAALEAVSEQDIRDVLQAMVREAKEGNAFAANLVLDRALGKVRPQEPEDADNTAETLERLWREWGIASSPASGDPEAPVDAAFTLKEAPGADPAEE